jgi:hypothetical protein
VLADAVLSQISSRLQCNISCTEKYTCIQHVTTFVCGQSCRAHLARVTGGPEQQQEVATCMFACHQLVYYSTQYYCYVKKPFEKEVKVTHQHLNPALSLTPDPLVWSCYPVQLWHCSIIVVSSKALCEQAGHTVHSSCLSEGTITLI